MLPFQLLSLPDGKPRIYLLQLPLKTSAGIDEVDVPRTVAHLDGSQLEAVRNLLNEILPLPTGLSTFLAEGGTQEIDETKAVRLSVAFAAIDNLRKKDRMQQMVDILRRKDEAWVSMWFKMLAEDKDGNIKQALRVALLGSD